MWVPSHQYEVQKADTDSVRASEVRDRDSSERFRRDIFSSMAAAAGGGRAEPGQEGLYRPIGRRITAGGFCDTAATRPDGSGRLGRVVVVMDTDSWTLVER